MMRQMRWAVFGLALLVAPTAIHAYTLSGHVQCGASGFPLYGGEVKAYEVDPVPGGSFQTELLFSATLGSTGDFTATVTWPLSGSGFEAGDPDLILQVTQTVGGSTEIVYEELSTSTRWNVADGSFLTLESESPFAICPDPGVSLASIPNDTIFLFTRIGAEETANIDCRGNDAAAGGYLRPRKAPFGPAAAGFAGSYSDQPFGRTLDLIGWFGALANVDYYKVQYSSDGGSSWHDVDTALPNKWYDTSDPNPSNWHWVPQSMGPFSVGSIDNLYQIPFFVRPGTPWSWLNRVGRFDTTKAPDGLNRLRIVAYKWASGSLVPATSSDVLIDPNYGEIVLQTDNTAPDVEILDVKLNGVSTAACNILNLGTGAADKVSIDFRVRDARGHLLSYGLDALYGHRCSVRPRPTTPNKAGDNYGNQMAATPSWLGSLLYTTDYMGSVYLPGPQIDCSSSPSPANRMPSCAYQFRLRGSKRTTNGYGLIYNNLEDTWHVTIQR